MKVKNIIHIVIIFVLLFALCGCSTLDMMVGLKDGDNKLEVYDDISIVGSESDNEEVVETITINTDVNMRDIIAYYKNEEGYLVPVKTSIPWEEGIAKATLSKIIIGDEVEKRMSQSGLAGVIPEGTEILGMSIKDGLCTIDFSENILNTASYDDEKLMISAISYTLTEFDTISSIKIMIGGQELQALSNGYPIDTAFERENINLVGSEDGANYVVYFKTPETEIAGYYIPFTFTAETVNDPIKTVLGKLFDGPPENIAVNNDIPYGITLNDVSVQNGIAVLDLSMGALNLEQEEYENLKKIVVLCLQQFDNISEIDYRVEGITFEEAGLELTDSEFTAVFNNFK